MKKPPRIRGKFVCVFVYLVHTWVYKFAVWCRVRVDVLMFGHTMASTRAIITVKK